jgi:hypothetical protein
MSGSDINASIDSKFKIKSAVPASAKPGDQIEIHGENFFEDLGLKFGNYEKSEFGLTNSENISYLIPKYFEPGLTTITITQGEQTGTIEYMVLTENGDVPVKEEWGETAEDFEEVNDFGITGPNDIVNEFPMYVTWDLAEEATGYHVMISPNGDCQDENEAYYSTMVYGETDTAEIPYLDDGDYFICVTAVMKHLNNLGANNNGIMVTIYTEEYDNSNDMEITFDNLAFVSAVKGSGSGEIDYSFTLPNNIENYAHVFVIALEGTTAPTHNDCENGNTAGSMNPHDSIVAAEDNIGTIVSLDASVTYSLTFCIADSGSTNFNSEMTVTNIRSGGSSASN